MKNLLRHNPAAERSPRTYSVRAGDDVTAVEGNGYRWTPGTPVPRDRQPDALLALARNAEAHEERHLKEEREGTRREGRRAA